MEHGMVLTRRELDYTDITKVGVIVIKKADHGVHIYVDGFEFKQPHSCRLNITKAMAWAKDVLSTAVHADTLVPGGEIVACADLPDGVEEALKR